MEAFRVAVNYLEGEPRAQYLGHPKFSGGKNAGPLWTMLWSAPLRFGGSPVSLLFILLLLNVATIPLVYLLARNLFGERCALWAALFYALFPWPVYSSVGGNNPAVMAFLGALLFLALWDVCSKPGSTRIFWVCLLLAAMPQFHMVGVFYVPFVLLVIWLSGSRVNRKWLAAGLLAAVAIYVPYIIGEMGTHWQNTLQILHGESKFQFGVLKIFTLQVNVLSSLISRWTGHSLSEYKAFGDAMFGSFYVLAVFNIISILFGILFVGNFLRDLYRSFGGRRFALRQAYASSPAIVFTGILLFGPLLLFSLTGRDFNTRYLYVQFPLLFCLPALFLLNIENAEKYRAVLFGGMFLSVVFNFFVSPVFFYYQRSQIENSAHFVPTLPGMEAVYKVLRNDTPPDTRIYLRCGDPDTAGQNEASEGIRFLTDYVSMREELNFLHKRPRKDKVFMAEHDLAGSGSHGRAIYEKNGLRLVAWSQANL